jgi:hypothetical protein
MSGSDASGRGSLTTYKHSVVVDNLFVMMDSTSTNITGVVTFFDISGVNPTYVSFILTKEVDSYFSFIYKLGNTVYFISQGITEPEELGLMVVSVSGSTVTLLSKDSVVTSIYTGCAFLGNLIKTSCGKLIPNMGFFNTIVGEGSSNCYYLDLDKMCFVMQPSNRHKYVVTADTSNPQLQSRYSKPSYNSDTIITHDNTHLVVAKFRG